MMDIVVNTERIDTHPVEPERGPSGEVGRGKPGRRLRRAARSAGRRARPWARANEPGKAWLERKRRAR